MSNDSALYALYKDAGFSWPLALSAISLNVMAIPGMFMNLAVIWVTFKTKSLHGTANFLLALYSLFEVLHQSGHLLFLWMAFSGRNFLPYDLAVRICTVSLFALGGVSPSMAFTGFDRLLCIVCPTFPKRVKEKPYLGLVTLICASFGAFMVYELYNNDVDPSTMVTGTIGDLNTGRAGAIYTAFSFPLYNLTIVLYIIAGILIKYRYAKNSMSSEDKRHLRIFRSLLIIISVNLGGYYFMRLFRLILGPMLGGTSIAYWYTMQAISVLVNMSAASNGPILYFTSNDYRNAFRAEFAHIVQKFGINVVMPMNTSQTPSAKPPKFLQTEKVGQRRLGTNQQKY